MKPRPELLAKIVECVNQGAGRTPKICAGKFGVNPTTFDRWMKQGADPECEDAAVARFYLDVHQAVSEQKLNLLDTIEKASHADWKAADRLLKIHDPELDEKRVTQPQAVQAAPTRLVLDVGDLANLVSVISQFVKPDSVETFIEGDEILGELEE